MTHPYTIDHATGILKESRQSPSPNQNQRPPHAPIDLLVLHNISLPPKHFGGPWIEQFFHNTLDPTAHPFFAEIQTLKVSAHLLLRRDGELIQFVPFHQRAWHAGVSEYAGRKHCNDFSIGIELEGSDHTPYEAVQYQQLHRVCLALMHSYPKITHEHIVGHNDIAPGRKTDPGPAFDWARCKGTLPQ